MVLWQLCSHTGLLREQRVAPQLLGETTHSSTSITEWRTYNVWWFYRPSLWMVYISSIYHLRSGQDLHWTMKKELGWWEVTRLGMVYRSHIYHLRSGQVGLLGLGVGCCWLRWHIHPHLHWTMKKELGWFYRPRLGMVYRSNIYHLRSGQVGLLELGVGFCWVRWHIHPHLHWMNKEGVRMM